jgi:hypothetical protein
VPIGTSFPIRRRGGGSQELKPATVPSGTVTRGWGDVNVRDSRYGAKGDVREGTATVLAGSLGLVAVAGYTPAQGDVLKTIVIAGATDRGFPFTTTIASIAGSQFSLAAPITNAAGVADVRVAWGTNDDAAFQQALTDAGTSSPLTIPHGTYFVRSAITASVRGSGASATKLIRLPDRTSPNGTYFPTGNWHPVLCNPQALAPAFAPQSTPDADWGASGVHVDLFADPSSPKAFNGLQGNGIELYSLTHATLEDLRVSNAPFSGIELACNRSGSEHGDGVGNAGSGTNSETPPSGAYLKEPAPCEQITAYGRLKARNFGWQWGLFFGATSGHRVWALINAGSTVMQVYDSASTTTVSGAGQAFPAGTLTVANTASFPSSGALMGPGVFGVVAYTGKTATTFTGCTGGTGTATNGGAVWSAADLSHYFPGLRIGIGSRGVLPAETPTNTNYEVATVKAVDPSSNTVTLDAPTTVNHNAAVQCGPVTYWGDPGFGVVVRQPAKHVYLDHVSADFGGWGGFSIGQAQQYNYDALSVRHIHVGRVMLTRCGAAGAPAAKFGFMDDVSVAGGFIGDSGGELLTGPAAGAKALILKTSQARRFFASEQIRVGLPSSALNEVATIASLQGFHIDAGAHLVNGSATVAVTANQWRVGEKIEGTGIVPQRVDAATVTVGSATVADTAISAADQGRPVSSSGIASPAYVGTVTPGVSFLLSSSPYSQINVNAIANAASVTVQVPNATVLSGNLAAGGSSTNPGDLVTGTSLTMSMNATTSFTGPLQGGDTLFLAAALANAHHPGEPVFYDPATAVGIAIEEVGTAVGAGVKLSNIEVLHQYDGVTITQKDAPPPPMQTFRHSLSGIQSRSNLRYGLREQDCQNVMHSACVAESNGDTGVWQSNANSSLQNLVYLGCQSYGNKNADWSTVAGKFQARGCLGIADV